MTARPRIGFLGTGWIGRQRMEAMVATGAIEAAAVADPSPEMAAGALRLAPGAQQVEGIEAMLGLGLDGVVIATPSALHAGQAIAVLERGAAVFCQKPLGRTAAETQSVVDAARRADRLLAVDLSYRFTEGVRRIRALIADGALGRVYAADLVFHNAYGPDKPWFYDPALAGGGCVMDLGVHLVDLALWALDFPAVDAVSAHLLAGGAPLGEARERVEDYAAAHLALESGASVRLACSWRLQAGCDAIISAAFYGTEGALSLTNVAGSFYDFAAELRRGTATTRLAEPPDDWGGRALVAWARRLAHDSRYDPAADELPLISRTIDRIYEEAS